MTSPEVLPGQHLEPQQLSCLLVCQGKQILPGLYSPSFEHDSCGFGLIANLDDAPSSWLVQTGLSALARLSHRGAVGADGKTGDGCGVLIHRPSAFLRAVALEAGITLPPEQAGEFAVGMVFLPQDAASAAHARSVLATALAGCSLAVLGWRVVPLNTTVCGEQALASMPRIEQVFVRQAAPVQGGHTQTFERALFTARRRAEKLLPPQSYVVTLSSHTIGYKAMVLPENMPLFYPDLARSDLAARVILFHQRFSTNTAPAWERAQPFRYLAHNGEINTIEGNRRWSLARGAKWRSDFIDFTELNPLVSLHGSDSQSLDNMLEALLAGGMDLLHAMRILVPPATSSLEHRDPDLSAFYEYHSLSIDPWDGPAGIVMCDSDYAACTMDRNGLRPARWFLTKDRILTVASEIGVWDCPDEQITAKGKLGPGQMLAIDLAKGEFLESATIDRINAARAPYKQWLKAGVKYLDAALIDPSLAVTAFDAAELLRFQKMFHLSREEIESVLRVLAETEQESTGSMGDDTPFAVLSHQQRSLYDYFRQAFAQVTNPPIDPLRERVVMSLSVQLGGEGNVFEQSAHQAQQVALNSPILSQRKLRQLLAMPEFANTDTRTGHALLHLYCTPEEGFERALARLCAQAQAAVRAGAVILLLTDRYPEPGKLPIHALLATGAIHQHLIRAGLRCDCNLLIETATARDPHHFACLIGFGATAVYPYLAYQTLKSMNEAGVIKLGGKEQVELGRSYRRGIKKGLLKIISKMGISTIASYRGAQLFEIVGLSDAVVRRCFEGTPARIQGAGFAELEADTQLLCERAWDPTVGLSQGGLLRYVHDGEYHMYNPDVIASLQRSVRSGDYADYRRYAEHVDTRPVSTLRDLMRLRGQTPIEIDAVEPITAILARFDSAGMSLGALSPEAHEALAIAMNRLGARSNSGEGGEDPARHHTEKSSKIKQIASGRFGVTAEYLMNAEVLQIKISQGAKPGEGGQLPGHKVNELIARLRYAKPGIGLISPPPHHDIYSIEDLAELIFDLKQINPKALVSVKLVSHAGIGTVAAGVVKAYADLITVSGYDGGTGASPISSIKYAGTPWELGLSEVQQTLRMNGLRHRVRVQVDGGFKTGLDVIKGAILGAESFGFGTAPMVALGCKYLRICHLNNCATGVATQDQRLREVHFTGLPEMAMNYFQFVARDVREHLATLGIARLQDLIGRVDLLELLEGETDKQRQLDLSPIIAAAGFAAAESQYCTELKNPPRDPALLSKRIALELADAIEHKTGGIFHYDISNRDRAIGAQLSGAIAQRYGNLGMSDAPIALKLTGVAGQSFGAWNVGGLHLHLTGDANDYVGKGMSGGKIVIVPSKKAAYVARESVILGNTCLYGATGGKLFAAGRAGERFAVRNSGATAVVEGAGDHCAEYMTGGMLAVLGRTGQNFGAGMTGGFAYVLDLERDFVDHCNLELIDLLRMSPEGMESNMQHLRTMLRTHHQETGSVWAHELIESFRDVMGKFWLVKPKAASLDSLIDVLKKAA
jgi:glutamate synthase (NADPH) large chain